jgi:peptidoglycan hydrolase CwlO-like protein
VLSRSSSSSSRRRQLTHIGAQIASLLDKLNDTSHRAEEDKETLRRAEAQLRNYEAEVQGLRETVESVSALTRNRRHFVEC